MTAIRTRWLTLAGFLCLAAFGCQQKKRTEIIVGLATDLTAPTPLRSVSMEVFRLPQMVLIGQQEFTISGDIDKVYELPGTYAVYSEGGTADRVRVVLTATDDSGAVLVVRSAVLTLVPERTLFVRLGVVSACRGKMDCPTGDSCVEGRCAPEEIDSTRLPDYRTGMEKVMECQSGTMFANTSTKQLLKISAGTDGGVPCGRGTCQEGICLAPTTAFSDAKGAMTENRTASQQIGNSLTTLDDGTALLMGGLGPNATPVLSSTETYSPQTGTFTARGAMSAARTYFGATKLHDGRVLVVGGINEGATALNSAEIYDPKTGAFQSTAGTMTEGRVFPATVTLTDGRVLIAGGLNVVQSYVNGTVSYFGALATAEVFDPATGMFSRVSPMTEGRAIPNIAALADGGALVSCGFLQGAPVRTIERFNATTGTFAAAPLPTVPGGAGACATAPIADGRLLVFADAGTWVYDAASGMFDGTGPEPKPRGEFVAVMSDGDVLFAGGDQGRRAYVFQAATRAFAEVSGDLRVARTGLAGALLPNGDVLIAGGDDDGTAEIFHRAGATASANPGGGAGAGSQMAARGGNDYIDWSQLTAGTLPTPLMVKSSQGLSASVSNTADQVFKEQQGNPWAGNFGPDDHILCSGQVTATGTTVVTFASPVRGVGTQMGSDVVSSTPVPFKEHLKLFDAARKMLGDFTANGMMHSGGDNSAVYIGASFPTAVIKTAEFSISDSGNAFDNAFCMNRISISR